MNFRNTKGVWKQHSWPKIPEMTELSLFRMAFTEQWVRDVLIPATNEEISGDNITLQELYVHLECHLSMACFEGISDHRLCWYPKLVSIPEGAPFWLQKYMALRWFISVEEETPNTGRKYTKTSRLMCEMTVPLRCTGEIVSMDSGFCVTVVILHFHEHGVYGQFLIKKRKYWRKGFPGEQIDSYMEGKPLGFIKNLRHDMGGGTFQHRLHQR